MKYTFLLVIVALGACVHEPIDGRTAFENDCASCHGNDARGGGNFGRQLIQQPPDLTLLAVNNGGIFPLNYVMSTIDGFARAPHFSGAMPEFGAGDMGDIVIVENDGLGTPVPMRLLALADYLESVQR